MPPHRIVSLLASGTELVCALGLGDQLVGRSHECDFPEWVARLPPVSRPTFDITGTSREIDQRVRERLHARLPLYEVDEAAIAALAPDVVITQTHCEVCAVSPAVYPDVSSGAPTPDAHGTTAPALSRKRVVALDTGSLDAILRGFGAVASVLDATAACEALVAGIRGRLSSVREATRALPRPTVVCLEWIDPVFAMGNWGPEIVEIAGGESLLGNPGMHSSSLAWDAVRLADPDVLVVAPCGFGIERTLLEMPTLASRPGWSDLSSVRAGRVYVADGNLYFNRSGPSVFETPAILAEMLHPGHFASSHEGTAWRRFAV